MACSKKPSQKAVQFSKLKDAVYDLPLARLWEALQFAEGQRIGNKHIRSRLGYRCVILLEEGRPHVVSKLEELVARRWSGSKVNGQLMLMNGVGDMKEGLELDMDMDVVDEDRGRSPDAAGKRKRRIAGVFQVPDETETDKRRDKVKTKLEVEPPPPPQELSTPRPHVSRKAPVATKVLVPLSEALSKMPKRPLTHPTPTKIGAALLSDTKTKLPRLPPQAPTNTSTTKVKFGGDPLSAEDNGKPAKMPKVELEKLSDPRPPPPPSTSISSNSKPVEVVISSLSGDSSSSDSGPDSTLSLLSLTSDSSKDGYSRRPSTYSSLPEAKPVSVSNKSSSPSSVSDSDSSSSRSDEFDDMFEPIKKAPLIKLEHRSSPPKPSRLSDSSSCDDDIHLFEPVKRAPSTLTKSESDQGASPSPPGHRGISKNFWNSHPDTIFEGDTVPPAKLKLKPETKTKTTLGKDSNPGLKTKVKTTETVDGVKQKKTTKFEPKPKVTYPKSWAMSSCSSPSDSDSDMFEPIKTKKAPSTKLEHNSTSKARPTETITTLSDSDDDMFEPIAIKRAPVTQLKPASPKGPPNKFCDSSSSDSDSDDDIVVIEEIKRAPVPTKLGQRSPSTKPKPLSRKASNLSDSSSKDSDDDFFIPIKRAASTKLKPGTTLNMDDNEKAKRSRSKSKIDS